jgi:hypothetical protein
MIQGTFSDGKTISSQTGRSRRPPPFDDGGMDVAHTYSWVLIEKDWYRWLGRNGVLLMEAIADAPSFTAAEWVNTLGEDLELFEEAIAQCP